MLFIRAYRIVASLVLAGALGVSSSVGCEGGLTSARRSLKGSFPKETFWRDTQDPSYLAGWIDDRWITAWGGQIESIGRLIRVEGGTLFLCDKGVPVRLETQREGELLVVRRELEAPRRMAPLERRPPELDISPLPLPDPHPLPEARIREIQSELWRRLRIDQETLAPQSAPSGYDEPGSSSLLFSSLPAPEASLERISVVADNSRFLRDLVHEVGWIDVHRFGIPAASAAFLLTQHSLDVRLMRAALPHLERDKAPTQLGGEPYALLYDRLKLLLGEKQRFGTQVDRSAGGWPRVTPLDEPEGVDERRRAFGMLPLGQYLKLFGGDGKIRISEGCDIPDP